MKKIISGGSLFLAIGCAFALANSDDPVEQTTTTQQTTTQTTTSSDKDQQAGVAAGLNQSCIDVNGVSYQRTDPGFSGCRAALNDAIPDAAPVLPGQFTPQH